MDTDNINSENLSNNENIESTKDSTKEEKQSSKKEKHKNTETKLLSEIEILTNKNEELKDKYLRIVAEYDNYRRRTAKERLELADNAKATILLDFLPVVDDMDRALIHIENNKTDDFSVNIEGVKLIADKFKRFLNNYGVQEIEANGKDFDLDMHEAVTKFQVSEEEQKGKVIDVIQTGYKMNDKVIRFAKVVVGE